MPLTRGTQIGQIPNFIKQKIYQYNNSRRGPHYNAAYNEYIKARNKGIAAAGSLSAWIASREAVEAIQALLKEYGMGGRTSQLVACTQFQKVLGSLCHLSLDWINGYTLPLEKAPAVLINPRTGLSLSDELTKIYDTLSWGGSVTQSGGFVAASKTAHCLFPNLAPMIDNQHTGTSYYNIAPYTPPLGIVGWSGWIGHPIKGKGVPNPSPKGAGRKNWGADQFLAAIGVNQHIYEMWDYSNGNPGLKTFLALDTAHKTVGIPRIIDKVLW